MFLYPSTINVHAVQDNSTYIHEQFINEIFDIETGEIISREYFDVVLSEEEFKAEETTETQQRVIPVTTVTVPSRGRVNLGRVNTGMNTAHSRSIIYLSGNVPSAHVSVETATLGTVLGSGTLSPNQSMRVIISATTLSYDVWISCNNGNGGSARFRVL